MADSVVKGLVQIKCDDGDVQMEPFSFWHSTSTGTTYNATFDNTGLKFFVCRKNGAIVDVQIASTGDSSYCAFKVNGKDTGVKLVIAGIIPSINNRMPTTIPIAAGAAVQITNA
jgi:hypothetical protein